MGLGKIILAVMVCLGFPILVVVGYLTFNLFTPVTSDNISDRLNLLCSIAVRAVREQSPIDCTCMVDVLIDELGRERTAELGEQMRSNLLIPRLQLLVSGEGHKRLKPEPEAFGRSMQKSLRQPHFGLETRIQRQCGR